MKKQMKMMISIMVIAVMLVVSIPLAYATGNTNFSVILTAKNTVKRGETVEVTVELDAFTGTGKGINSFMGDLEYDKTKLSIESSQIVAQNGWDAPMYENDKVLTAKGSMVTAKEAIMKMTFTVKSDAVLGETTITIKNAEAANDENDFVGTEGTINIEITAVNTEGECEHTYGEYVDNENGTHSRECTKCNEKHTENCEYELIDGKRVCSKCSAEFLLCDEDEHKGTVSVVDNGDGTHTTICQVCGEEIIEKHTYENGKCTACDAVDPTNDKKEEGKKDTTTADKEYDKAGTGTIISLATAIVAVIAIIMYRKNKKYQDII